MRRRTPLALLLGSSVACSSTVFVAGPTCGEGTEEVDGVCEAVGDGDGLGGADGAAGSDGADGAAGSDGADGVV